MNNSRDDDPKRRVLSHLKRSGAASTQAVSATLNVTDVAARQHLFALERQGLVVRVAAAAGSGNRGRPGDRWKLTPLAHDLFPDRHDALTVDILEAIETALGPGALQQVVGARTERQFAALRRTVTTDTGLRQRLEALVAQRTLEGYMAEVVEAGDAFLLIEHHCPICDAAKSCQLFCTTELDLFRRVLGPDVEVSREQHLLSGDDRCVYRVAARSVSQV